MAYFFNTIESGNPIDTTFDPITSHGMKLKTITTKVNAAPTTSENLVLSLVSRLGAAFNVEIYSLDLAAASTTDDVNTDINLPLDKGDALRVVYPNTERGTFGIQVILTSGGD